MAMNCNDPAKPNEVYARDFSRPVGRLLLAAEGSTVRTWSEMFNSNAKMGEYAGLVHGVISKGGTKTQLSDGILSPTAIFKGLRRPLYHVRPDADRAFYIYITNPQQTFFYGDRTNPASLEPRRAPIESVFATYVTFEQEHIDRGWEDVRREAQPQGLVVGWEWLERSPRESTLPYDHESRFSVRVL